MSTLLSYPEKAEQLMENYQPPYDEESLQIMLQNLNPKVGLKRGPESPQVQGSQNLVRAPISN
jgi:hypothetical protein